MSRTFEPHPHRFGTTATLATALTAFVVLLIARPSAAQDGTPAPRETPAAQTPDTGGPHPLARWVDAQTVTVSTRYDYIGDARDRTVQNRMQTQVQIRAGFKVDAAGRYSVRAGLFSGNNFSSGWNPTGIGTGEGTAKIYLTQLFVRAEPWRGTELLYGSMDAARGESTEITTYDNDAYITAGRVSLRRPARWLTRSRRRVAAGDAQALHTACGGPPGVDP
jgi:hypothetical protein